MYVLCIHFLPKKMAFQTHPILSQPFHSPALVRPNKDHSKTTAEDGSERPAEDAKTANGGENTAETGDK